MKPCPICSVLDYADPADMPNYIRYQEKIIDDLSNRLLRAAEDPQTIGRKLRAALAENAELKDTVERQKRRLSVLDRTS